MSSMTIELNTIAGTPRLGATAFEKANGVLMVLGILCMILGCFYTSKAALLSAVPLLLASSAVAFQGKFLKTLEIFAIAWLVLISLYLAFNFV